MEERMQKMNAVRRRQIGHEPTETASANRVRVRPSESVPAARGFELRGEKSSSREKAESTGVIMKLMD